MPLKVVEIRRGATVYCLSFQTGWQQLRTCFQMKNTHYSGAKFHYFNLPLIETEFNYASDNQLFFNKRREGTKKRPRTLVKFPF